MPNDPLRVWAGPSTELDVVDRIERGWIAPILRAQVDDRHSPADRAARYGALLTSYQMTDLEDAEVALLPRAYERSTDDELASLLKVAERRGLRTLVFAMRDHEPLMPSASVILMHPGPTRDAQPHADSIAYPYFLTDRAFRPQPRPDDGRPKVAFCGQGQRRMLASVGNLAVRLGGIALYRVRPRVVPQPVRGHVSLRSAALRNLADHPSVDEHFVIRDQYRAGVSSEDERARTQAEFDDNLRSATYALCVRGTGNFSARFYEALSFGRVPLFVNTNCVLPFEDEIDWRARTVWVEARDVRSIGDRLVAAHPEVLGDPDRSAEGLRQLWEEWLTQDGYFAHLPAAVRRLL